MACRCERAGIREVCVAIGVYDFARCGGNVTEVREKSRRGTAENVGFIRKTAEQKTY